MVLLNLVLAATLAQAEPPAEPAVEPAAVASAPLATVSPASVSLSAGLAAYKMRRYAQAEDEFEKALKADPNSAAAAYYLGYTIYKRVEKRPFHPDKTRAAKLFDQAFTLDPTFRPDWGRVAAKH
jgi:tetratricopeptide (TPR) repeat protein